MRLGLVAIAVCAVTAVLDPSRTDAFPSCPVRALTGHDCPGCGTLRGLHALFGGNVGGALDHNVLLALGIPVATYAYLAWLLQGCGLRLPQVRARPVSLIALAGLIGVFTVSRNLPLEPLSWLASGG